MDEERLNPWGTEDREIVDTSEGQDVEIRRDNGPANLSPNAEGMRKNAGNEGTGRSPSPDSDEREKGLMKNAAEQDSDVGIKARDRDLDQSTAEHNFNYKNDQDWTFVERNNGGFGSSLTWGCCYLQGALDSEGRPPASASDVLDILHHSRFILGAYGTDLEDLTKLIQQHDPKFDGKSVVKFDHPVAERGACPPYFICVHHERREVAMYIRGLNLLHKDDYYSLMSNRKGEQAFMGGYLHQGMYKSAKWSLEHVGPILKQQLLEHEGYRLTIVGHSLGAGVAAVLTCLLVENREVIGGIDRDLIRAYSIAPPRVVSLDLAIKYASNIYSVIYQDDFLPRISTSTVKRIFRNAFAFTGVVIFYHWIKQACHKRPVEDIYRLYPPGLIFHVVYKKLGNCTKKIPIQVQVLQSSRGHFERLVLSTGTASDHSVLKMAKHLKTYNWPAELQGVVNT